MIYEKNLSHLQRIKKGIVTQEEEEEQLEQALPSTHHRCHYYTKQSQYYTPLNT
jgi:hypothetical protein